MRNLLKKTNFLWPSSIALLVLLGTCTYSIVMLVSLAKAAPTDSPIGYGASTTGGADGTTITVTTLSDLVDAVGGSTPSIVKVSGIITGNQNIIVGSNKTIVGIGSNSGLNGLCLKLKNVKNVIVRNLILSNVRPTNTMGDAIYIAGSTNVWVDHNDLHSDRNHGMNYYDGLLDINHGSDNITVSWNRFHDHFKVSLIGATDSEEPLDTENLHVTYHHNWFYNVFQRIPSLRFGTGHVFNNYYQNVSSSAIHSRMGAQMLVQNNVFRNVKLALSTTKDSSKDGYANASGNDYGGASVKITQVGTFTNPPYDFTLDETSSVISNVSNNSGVGIVG